MIASCNEADGKTSSESAGIATVFDISDAAAVRRLFDEVGLLVIKGQKLSEAELIALADIFGGAGTSPIARKDGGPTKLSIITNRLPDGSLAQDVQDDVVGKIDWHTDQAYVATPNRGKLLYAVEVPEQGGKTGFIDGARLYAGLPLRMQAAIEGLHVILSWRHAQETLAMHRRFRPNGDKALASDRYADIIAPLVQIHPVSGRRILNMPPLWAFGIAELPDKESENLLQELREHVSRPEFAYWHSYEPGDVVTWDNWRYLHAAGGTPARFPRTLWSVTIHGDVQMGTVSPV